MEVCEVLLGLDTNGGFRLLRYKDLERLPFFALIIGQDNIFHVTPLTCIRENICIGLRLHETLEDTRQ